MRAVVLREYTDRVTGKGHTIGEKVSITKERFDEIQNKGAFLKEIAKEPAKAPRKKKESDN